MFEPVGTYTFTIDAYLSDFRGKATLPMLGGFMLQAATKHAEERGFGYSVMTANGKVWVLSRMYISMLEYPNNETDIKINTWITDMNKLFTERCFSIEDGKGKEIGFARTLWAAIDIKSRQPCNILEMNDLSRYISHKTCLIETARKVVHPKTKGEKVQSFTVQYSDIDINKHLNSMKYIEHFVDVFPIEMYQQNEIRDILINYQQEGHYGETLDIIQNKTTPGEVVLTMKNSDRIICLAKVNWKQHAS